MDKSKPSYHSHQMATESGSRNTTVSGPHNIINTRPRHDYLLRHQKARGILMLKAPLQCMIMLYLICNLYALCKTCFLNALPFPNVIRLGTDEDDALTLSTISYETDGIFKDIPGFFICCSSINFSDNPHSGTTSNILKEHKSKLQLSIVEALLGTKCNKC